MKRKNEALSEADIRRAIEKKYQARLAFIQHATSYLIVNAVLWAIWGFASGGFPWPLFVTAFWGIGMLSHLADFYYKYWKGAQKRDDEIAAEISRLQGLAALRQDAGEPFYADDEIEETLVYELDKVKPSRLRLTDDGELLNETLIDDEDWRGQAQQNG